MTAVTRTTDQKARISLPRGFANSTVIMEEISENEVRIRKAKVIPEDEVSFHEESMKPLCDKDRDLFLAALEKPPQPNQALKHALKSHRKDEDYGN